MNTTNRSPKAPFQQFNSFQHALIAIANHSTRMRRDRLVFHQRLRLVEELACALAADWVCGSVILAVECDLASQGTQAHDKIDPEGALRSPTVLEAHGTGTRSVTLSKLPQFIKHSLAMTTPKSTVKAQILAQLNIPRSDQCSEARKTINRRGEQLVPEQQYTYS